MIEFFALMGLSVFGVCKAAYDNSDMKYEKDRAKITWRKDEVNDFGVSTRKFVEMQNEHFISRRHNRDMQIELYYIVRAAWLDANTDKVLKAIEEKYPGLQLPKIYLSEVDRVKWIAYTMEACGYDYEWHTIDALKNVEAKIANYNGLKDNMNPRFSFCCGLNRFIHPIKFPTSQYSCDNCWDEWRYLKKIKTDEQANSFVEKLNEIENKKLQALSEYVDSYHNGDCKNRRKYRQDYDDKEEACKEERENTHKEIKVYVTELLKREVENIKQEEWYQWDGLSPVTKKINYNSSVENILLIC